MKRVWRRPSDGARETTVGCAGELADAPAETAMSLKDAVFALREFTHDYAGRLGATAAMATLAMAAVSAEPLVVAMIFDELLRTRRGDVLIAWLAGWIGLALVSAFAVLVRDRLAASVAAEVGRDLRRKLADRELHALAPSDGLEVTALSGVEGVTAALGVIFPSLMGGLAGLTMGTLTAWILDWRVALVMLGAVGPILWLNTHLSRRLQVATAAYTSGIKKLAAEARRFFHPAGRELAATLRARREVMSRTEPIVSDLREADEKRLVAGNFFPAVKIVGTGMGVAAVGVAYLLGGISWGRQVGFVQLARQQVDMMLAAVMWFAQFANQVPHIQMVSEALAAPIERKGGQLLDKPRGHLEFHQATAGYIDGRAGVTGLSLIIEPGEAVALVGESGAGKTTLGKLATGFPRLELRHGAGVLDGVSLGTLQLDVLRQTIVRVPQTAWIFEGTVAENLLPPPGGTAEDLEWACRLALLHDQILAWPDGYGTQIDSSSVSGGEAQRLGVARALLRVRLREARMMVLDEATAALDPEAAQRLLDGLIAYLASDGIGALVITHKLPVHDRLPRVVVLSGEGRVIEDGDPRKLAADPGSAYARLIAGGEPPSPTPHG